MISGVYKDYSIVKKLTICETQVKGGAYTVKAI